MTKTRRLETTRRSVFYAYEPPRTPPSNFENGPSAESRGKRPPRSTDRPIPAVSTRVDGGQDGPSDETPNGPPGHVPRPVRAFSGTPTLRRLQTSAPIDLTAVSSTAEVLPGSRIERGKTDEEFEPRTARIGRRARPGDPSEVALNPASERVDFFRPAARFGLQLPNGPTDRPRSKRRL